MDAASLYPLPTKEELAKEFLGKSIKDVATPAAIIDFGKVKNNCSRMLEACEALGFGWRAHIKTHKVGSEQLLSLFRMRIMNPSPLFAFFQTRQYALLVARYI